MWYTIAFLCGGVGGAVAMYYIAPKLASIKAKVKAAAAQL